MGFFSKGLTLAALSFFIAMPGFAAGPAKHAGVAPAPAKGSNRAAAAAVASKPCFDAAKWFNACVRKETKVRETVVDVRFPGHTVPPTPEWLLNNYGSLTSADSSTVGKTYTNATQDGCKTISADGTILKIEKYGPDFVEVTIDPKSPSLTKDNAGFEGVVASIIASTRMRIERKSDTAVTNTTKTVTDGRMTEVESILRCAPQLPVTEEKVSPAVKQLGETFKKLSAIKAQNPDSPALKTPAGTKTEEIAFVDRFGKPVYVSGTSESRQAEAEKFFADYVKSKGKVQDKLEPVEALRLAQQMLKEKGGKMSVNARVSTFNSLIFGRVLVNVKIPAALKDSPQVLRPSRHS